MAPDMDRCRSVPGASTMGLLTPTMEDSMSRDELTGLSINTGKAALMAMSSLMAMSVVVQELARAAGPEVRERIAAALRAELELLPTSSQPAEMPIKTPEEQIALWLRILAKMDAPPAAEE
jgi:hypothetical protein